MKKAEPLALVVEGVDGNAAPGCHRAYWLQSVFVPEKLVGERRKGGDHGFGKALDGLCCHLRRNHILAEGIKGIQNAYACSSFWMGMPFIIEELCAKFHSGLANCGKAYYHSSGNLYHQ